jgi:hypothetical protein
MARERSFEGWRRRVAQPTFFSAYPAERKAATMSATDLKRKLRNFPAANLNQRISA